jgi:hypothetical protein
LAFGPLVLVAAALLLLVRPVRAWLRPTRRVVGVWVAVVAAVVAVSVLVPAGWIRLPPGPGGWVSPAYVGRPSSTHAVAGPVGESPTVVAKKYDVGDCTGLVVADGDRLVALCGGTRPVLRLVDPDSLRTKVRTELPGTGCAGRLAATDDGAVASSGRRVVRIDTSDLAIAASVDLSAEVESGDCLTGVGADGAGRTWFATRSGLVGVVDGDDVRTVDLDDEVDRPLTVADEGAYVAGARALHRVGLVHGRPAEAWASSYDDGGERGSAPVVLGGNLLAVADNRKPRLQVVMHRADTGEVVCRAEVFDDDAGAADGGLVAAGDGVVVTNAHGYGGPLSTVLGRTTSRGIAYVDRDCTVTWTTDMNAPSGAPAVSLDDGLVYAWTKRHSWLGVDAWYLSALDLDTGRLMWARRTGLTPLADNHGGPVVLGPQRTVYAPVLGGLVRVRDRD